MSDTPDIPPFLDRRALTSNERLLLNWLVGDDGQYGECYGPTLDSLIARGFAAVGDKQSGLSNSFIAKGTDIMFRTVSITEAGYEALNVKEPSP